MDVPYAIYRDMRRHDIFRRLLNPVPSIQRLF